MLYPIGLCKVTNIIWYYLWISMCWIHLTKFPMVSSEYLLIGTTSYYFLYASINTVFFYYRSFFFYYWIHFSLWHNIYFILIVKVIFSGVIKCYWWSVSELLTCYWMLFMYASSRLLASYIMNNCITSQIYIYIYINRQHNIILDNFPLQIIHNQTSIVYLITLITTMNFYLL